LARDGRRRIAKRFSFVAMTAAELDLNEVASLRQENEMLHALLTKESVARAEASPVEESEAPSWISVDSQSQRQAQYGLDEPFVEKFVSGCEFISLGCSPATTRALQGLGVKRWTYPFDMCRSPLDGILYSFRTEFTDFLTFTRRTQDEECDLKVFTATKWGGSFWHVDLDAAQTRTTYARRVDRMLGRRDVSNEKPRIFVRAVNCTRELLEVPVLFAECKRLFPHALVKMLIIIDLQKEEGPIRILGDECDGLLFYRVHEDVFLSRHFNADRQCEAYVKAIAFSANYWAADCRDILPAVMDIESLSARCQEFDGGSPACEKFHPLPFEGLSEGTNAERITGASTPVRSEPPSKKDPEERPSSRWPRAANRIREELRSEVHSGKKESLVRLDTQSSCSEENVDPRESREGRDTRNESESALARRPSRNLELSLLKEVADWRPVSRRSSHNTDFIARDFQKNARKRMSPPRRGVSHEPVEKFADFQLHDALEPGELLVLKAFGSEVKVRFPGGVSAGRTVRLKRDNGTIVSKLLPYSGDTIFPLTMGCVSPFPPAPASPPHAGHRGMASPEQQSSTSIRQMSPTIGDRGAQRYPELKVGGPQLQPSSSRVLHQPTQQSTNKNNVSVSAPGQSRPSPLRSSHCCGSASCNAQPPVPGAHLRNEAAASALSSPRMVGHDELRPRSPGPMIRPDAAHASPRQGSQVARTGAPRFSRQGRQDFPARI